MYPTLSAQGGEAIEFHLINPKSPPEGGGIVRILL